MEKIYDTVQKITAEFEVQTHQGQCDEMISCFIPATNMYFSARTAEDVTRKGRAMIQMFVKLWNEYNQSDAPKDFTFMKNSDEISA